MNADHAKPIVAAIDSLTRELRGMRGTAVCEICGAVFMYLITAKTKKHKPRTHAGHCALVLAEREGRVQKMNWNTIRNRRKEEN